MSLAGSSVRVHLQLLRWCGFCRAPRAPRAGAPRAPRLRPHDVYRALTLCATGAYLVQECIYAYQERGDMEKLSRVMFLLLCHVTSIVKQVVFSADADRIDAMIEALDAPLYNGGGAAAARLRRRTARGAARFVRAYAGAAVLTCALWAVFPALDRARRLPVEFPFWVGFHYDRSFRFSMVLCYSYYVTTLVGIANTTMDAFIATLLNQSKTQLTILRMQLEEIPTAAAAAAAGSREPYEAALRRLLLGCLAHYNKIYENTKMLQDIFGFAILVQFGIGGWILCMAAYKIVSLSVLSVEFASMTLFICCILTELFLYCYYGNEVQVESSLVAQSVYSMEWCSEAVPVRFRRALLVVMERARRPLRPAAGLVIPLSLDTFLKIIKSSYTFYTVLRQTK